MPRRLTVAIIAAGFLTGVAPTLVSAQDAPAPAPRQRQGPPQMMGLPEKERPADVLGLDERVTIDFKGGTVAEYIQTVRNAASPKAVNILVPTEVNDVPLPPIRLQSVTLWTAWTALEPAIRAQPAGIDIAIAAMGERAGSTASSEAVQVMVDRARRFGATFPSDPVRTVESVEVISIADLVEPRATGSDPVMTPQDVLAAVESAVLIAGDTVSATPVLKYHPATGVLISRGTPTANALVREVVGTIRQNAAVRGDQLDRAKLARDMYEQRRNQARAQLEAAESDVESAGRRLVDLEKAAQSGAISKLELESARETHSAVARRADQAKQQLAMIERMGVEGVQTELAIKGQKDNLTDRVAQLEREVEALKTLLNMSTGRPATPQPGRPGR